MELAGRWIFAILCWSLAGCVLGRPQPSSAASPQYSVVEVFDKSSLQDSSRILGCLQTLEVPWRRSLKRRGGRVGGGAGGRGAGGRGAGGGGGNFSTTDTIIVVASILAFVLLITAFVVWYSRKKKKNPNWRFADCFKRKKLPREKMLTSVKSDVDPDAAAEHEVAMDVPRLDNTAKSRKQVSLSHDPKNSSNST